MLTRRTLLAGAVAMPGVPRSSPLRFHLRRDGSWIGTHVIRFERGTNRTNIAIAVDIAVRFGPLVLYRYKLRGREHWEGGRCMAASAAANDDGTRHFMRATRRNGALLVEGSGTAPYAAPAGAVIASHWNEAELHGPWINLQDGKLLHPRVTPLGSDPVRLANGTLLPASCYSITGPANIRIWYTPSATWTGLVFVARDGSHVRYERVS
ncbi:MAG: hypothetical protein KGK10_05590 [Rhodospirillales bacterium]|nr:hypothetical protein [Rhodospirillales bacterium]